LCFQDTKDDIDDRVRHIYPSSNRNVDRKVTWLLDGHKWLSVAHHRAAPVLTHKIKRRVQVLHWDLVIYYATQV